MAEDNPRDPQAPDAGAMRRALLECAATRMPFGKYGPDGAPPKGRLLVDLPHDYLIWMKRKGFPRGRLGELLATLYEVRAESGELFEKFRRITKP